MSNLSAVSDGLRVLTTIVVERRRGGRTRRARHGPLDSRAVAVPASGLIQIETAFLRMLYVLYSIEHGRPCIHLGRTTGHPAADRIADRDSLRPESSRGPRNYPST